MTTRRRFLTGAAGLLAIAPVAGLAQDGPQIHVMKDATCGCCRDWIAILQQEGFAVTSQDIPRGELARYKMENGIRPEMASCHTGRIEGYMIEGHVPAADIRRLLKERPDAVGLTVPGMPYGSPGMGPETQREAYDVLLMRRDGTAEVFATYAAA